MFKKFCVRTKWMPPPPSPPPRNKLLLYEHSREIIFFFTGSYCIYKYSSCPSGMKQGYVKWDDEDTLFFSNANDKKNPVPYGVYDHDTKIYYCCQNSGKWNDPIELPIDRPFYLLPHSGSTNPKCQLVKGTKNRLEYILYDTADAYVKTSLDEGSGSHVYFDFIITGFGVFRYLKVYYCYYEGKFMKVQYLYVTWAKKSL